MTLHHDAPAASHSGPVHDTSQSMLASVRTYALRHAEVIARVTGLDVEIVDDRLMRIAGTGVYAAGVGQSLEFAGELYREVMRTRQTVFVETPREHALCMQCRSRPVCRETLSVSTPILVRGKTAGVIGLVCFDQEGRTRILEQRESYLLFINLLADALGHRIHDRRELDNATRLLDLMLQVVHANNQGIMILSRAGTLTYANAPAREQLGIPPQAIAPESVWPGAWSGQGRSGVAAPMPHSFQGDVPRVSLRRTGTLAEFDEFEFRLGEAPPRHVIGRLIQPETSLDACHSVLICDTPDRLAQRLGNLTVNSGEGLDAIIGHSEALRHLKNKVLAVAGSSSTVLITGESGTGKELVARAIHQESPRRDGPFVAINCGGIPENLLESELFGYVSGAFTGASRKGHMGKFELAHGGVIFLDEISTMPLYLQVKLLRVLQERAITRLGSNRRIEVDIRIIAATNQNLRTCIEQMTFRDDLFYRLNVIPLDTPALRTRREDIAVLAEHFLSKYGGLFQKRVPELGPDIRAKLEAYAWPGNVRELEHVMEYAVNMMRDGGALTPACLPPRLLEDLPNVLPHQSGSEAHEAASGVAGSSSTELTLQGLARPIVPLHELEREAIQAALDHFGRDTEGKRQAAAALGLSVATLYRKIKA